jgi:hypothetical protein
MLWFWRGHFVCRIDAGFKQNPDCEGGVSSEGILGLPPAICRLKYAPTATIYRLQRNAGGAHVSRIGLNSFAVLAFEHMPVPPFEGAPACSVF